MHMFVSVLFPEIIHTLVNEEILLQIMSEAKKGMAKCKLVLMLDCSMLLTGSRVCSTQRSRGNEL